MQPHVELGTKLRVVPSVQSMSPIARPFALCLRLGTLRRYCGISNAPLNIDAESEPGLKSLTRIHPKNSSADTLSALKKGFALYENYLSLGQQQSLVAECFSALKKMSWSVDHFDSAIVNYREITLREEVLQKLPALRCLVKDVVQPEFFRPPAIIQDPHVLHLASNGFIKPHLDSVPPKGLSPIFTILLSFIVLRRYYSGDLTDIQSKDALS